MDENRLKVLFVEDNADHAIIVMHELKKGGYDPDLKRIDKLEDVKKAFDQEPWDVILCDYGLPGFTGIDVIDEYNKRHSISLLSLFQGRSVKILQSPS